jgi:hypothetical protein
MFASLATLPVVYRRGTAGHAVPQDLPRGPPAEARPFRRGMGRADELCNGATMFTGACLCGSLRYEQAGPLHALWHCHCSMCRKHHGAPFASIGMASLDRFRWLSREASVVEYASSAARKRRFCGTCGSVAPAPLGDRVLLPAGNLPGELAELGQVGAQHVFVGSKAPWHVIADGLPQHEALPPSAPAGWTLQEVPCREVPQDGAVHGSCLCGAVTFSVSGAPLRWMQCHCSRCRRGRSAVHGSNAFYPAEHFTWLTGRELVRKYKPPDAQRFAVSFCTRCGGGAPVERDNVPFVLLPAALFDTDPGARPEAHIFVGSKAAWYNFGDGLPQYDELPPA